MDKKPSLFEFLGPGKSFVLGIIATFLVIFSIGFFWLLFNGQGNTAKNDKSLAAFNQPAQPAANDDNQAAPSGQINIQPVSSEDYIRGDIESAQVVIVEFSDIDCPFCSRFHPTMKQVLGDYVGKVAWVYRHFPLDSLHPQARAKAEAAECVGSLGGNDVFWQYLDLLYEQEVDDLVAFAKNVGVDETKFNDCVKANTFKDKVQNQYQDAINSGGQGTPYSVVLTRDGQRVPISGALPIANIKSIIDPLLQ